MAGSTTISVPLESVASYLCHCMLTTLRNIDDLPHSQVLQRLQRFTAKRKEIVGVRGLQGSCAQEVCRLCSEQLQVDNAALGARRGHGSRS